MAARVFAGACTVYAVVVVALAGTLPDRVPLHFGADLQADRSGDRAELLLVATATGLLLTALFGGFARLGHRVPLHLVNVPHAEFWKAPAHADELRRRIRTDVLVIGSASLLLVAAELALVGVAARAGTGLSGWSVVLLVAFFVGAVGWAGWLGTRRYRPPERGTPGWRSTAD